jgi:hypothetical protein
MDRHSVLPLAPITVPLVYLLAAFGVIGWDVVLGVAIAVGVVALAGSPRTH